MKENTKFNKKQYLYRLIIFMFIAISIIFPRNSFAFLDFIKFIGHNAESMGRGGTAIGIGDEPSNANFNSVVPFICVSGMPVMNQAMQISTRLL